MNIIQKQQETELKKFEICFEILRNARSELYLGMRFMDVALSSVQFLPDSATATIGCDGSVFHFDAEYLIQSYKQNPIMINRFYLHQIMHCLFGHIWKRPQDMETEVAVELEGVTIEHAQELAGKMQWNLACDIAAEYLIDSFFLVDSILDGLEENIIIQNEDEYYLLKLNEGKIIVMSKDELDALFQEDKMVYFNPNHRIEGVGDDSWLSCAGGGCAGVVQLGAVRKSD